MTDFDLTQVPTIVAQRLDAVAADAQTQGQQMFTQALADQRALLTALASPASSLLTGTATFAQRLASGPPPASGGDGAPASTDPASTDEPAPPSANT